MGYRITELKYSSIAVIKCVPPFTDLASISPQTTHCTRSCRPDPLGLALCGGTLAQRFLKLRRMSNLNPTFSWLDEHKQPCRGLPWQASSIYTLQCRTALKPSTACANLELERVPLNNQKIEAFETQLAVLSNYDRD